ncbi:hypothetical protein SAMN05216431_11319 [Ligilactobacillus sp. WC1T17]|uniref:Cyclophilin-like domain-containing protein n=2 Tax=Ligilactobacillus TaxID=2767887 RepID=A0ABY1AD97_9LACO|nr:hypothetical protein SAMN05216431_11319 [Ligilactobacillus ruminis]
MKLKGGGMQVKISVAGHEVVAKLKDNAAAKKLWDSLPQTFNMQNLYGLEMCARLGRGALPTREAQNMNYAIGDMSYWPPLGSLVILYQQNGEIFEQEPLGHIDNDISFFEGMLTSAITFSKI